MKPSWKCFTSLIGFCLIGCSGLRAATFEYANRCELAPPVSVPQANADSFGELLREIYSYSLGTDKLGRPASLQPEAVLPRLHPWFQEGKSFCKEKSDEMEIVRLAPIPAAVIADIGTLSGRDIFGIGILNGDFWNEVAGIQAAGLEAGFFVNSGEHEFAGYYSHDSKQIMFDVLANPGTPAHELRHHQQHTAVERSQLQPQGQGYSPKCQVAARRFFDELDANTYQMRSWIPALRFNESHVRGKGGAPAMFPHLELLMGFLNYPALAAGWVEKEHCPKVFAEVLRQIKGRAQRFQNMLIGPLGQFKGLSTAYLMDPPDASAKQELEDLRAKIEDALTRESAARSRELNVLIGKLPPEDRAFLSSISGGFKFLNELKGY